MAPSSPRFVRRGPMKNSDSHLEASTTRLVANSLDLFDVDLRMLESRQFILPLLSARATEDPRGSQDFTLNQFNMIVAPDGDRLGSRSSSTIRGRALILWDLKILGRKKKLDAIDTDQITPAADCVSESLDTLDERMARMSGAGSLPTGTQFHRCIRRRALSTSAGRWVAVPLASTGS